MTDPTLDPTTPVAADATPSVATAQTAKPEARHLSSTTVGWVAWAALALALAALAGVAWQTQQLRHAEQTMARRAADTQALAVQSGAIVNKNEALVRDLEARFGVAELRLSEVSLQRSQLEELILTVSRTRDDSLVQDLEAGVRLAMQQSQLTGSALPLISALQGAAQRIDRAAQPRLNPVQRAIERDVARLQAAALLDVPTLVARIDELIHIADAWPLRQDASGRPTPAPDPASAPTSPADTHRGETDALSTTALVDASDDDPENASPVGAWERVHARAQRTWDQWIHGLHSTSVELVRISRIDAPEAALMSPDQAYFLRQNLKLMLLNARLGLLTGRIATARADLASTHSLVQRYYNDDVGLVRVALVTLTQLERDTQQDPLPRPDETLSALAVASGGR